MINLSIFNSLKSLRIILPILFIVFFVPNMISGQDNGRLVVLLDSLNHIHEQKNRIIHFLKISEEYQKSNFSKALEYSEYALDLSNKLGEKDLEYTSMLSKAQSFFLMFEMDSSKFYLDQILMFKDEIVDKRLLGDVFSLYGSVNKKEGDYLGGIHLLKKAIGYHKSDDNIQGLAEAHNRIALIFQSISRDDSCIYYSIKATKLFSQIGDSIGIIKTLGNTGKSYINLKEFLKAKRLFLLASKVCIAKKHQRFEGLTYNNLGRVNLHLEINDSAMYYFEAAREIYEKIKNKSGKANAIMNIGAAYDKLKEFDKAERQFREALRIFTEIKNTKGIVNAKSNIALIHERKGRYKEALLIYDTVVQLCIQYNNGHQLAHTYYNIYKTHELAGNFKKAFEYQSLHYQLQDSLFSLQKAEMIAKLELQYQKEKNESEILFLQNVNLTKDLKIKKQKGQRNLIIAIGSGLLLIFIILLINNRQRSKRTRQLNEKEIARLKEEKRALAAKALLEGQEKERKRVATELHDGLGVLLSNVKLQFTSFIDKNPENKNLLEKANDVLEQASSDVRRISHNMMPGVLMKLGLLEAIRDLLDEINEGGVIEANLEVTGEEHDFEENTEIILYRIFQELINNTLKHAEAKNISIVINYTHDQVYIQYSDNGKGFSLKESKAEPSMGLQSIESRIDFLGGEMQLETEESKGVMYSIFIPLS